MGWTVMRSKLFAHLLSACHSSGSREHASKHDSQIAAWRNLFHVLLHGLFHQTRYPIAQHARSVLSQSIRRPVLYSQSLSKIIEWAAKRSYSIYLLQYATIEFATNAIYAGALNGEYSTLAWSLRLATWILATALAYGLALAIASVVDTFIIEPIQTKLKQYRLTTTG